MREKWTTHKPSLQGAPEVRDEHGGLVALTYPVPMSEQLMRDLGMTEEQIRQYRASPEGTDYSEASRRAQRIADLPDIERDIRWLLRNFDRWVTKNQWKKLDKLNQKYNRSHRKSKVDQEEKEND